MANSALLGLDVGSVRIGVARARLDVRLPQPLTTVPYGPEAYGAISALAGEQDAAGLVVGWPRGLEGQTTDQTRFVESFVDELRKHTDLPIHMQDEALTSHKAEAELGRRGKPYAKADVDALAATYILEDYLRSDDMAIGRLSGEGHV